MQQSRLFLALPEYISTPDGMEIDQEGNLILSCPNFAQPETSGCVVKIGKDKKVTKWFDTPVHPKTGKARQKCTSLKGLAGRALHVEIWA